MATTTNYGWATPDDTALVKDGASAIRTLGSSVDTTTKNLNPETTLGDLSFRSSTSNVNTRIPIGSSGQHLTVVAGVPAWATASDQTPLTTKGDLLGFSTLDARIPIGANGTLLTADSTETLGLKWAAPAGGGGKVLQVVQASTTTDTTITSTTFADTTLTATITPTLNTSKILILIAQTGYGFRSTNTAGFSIKLLRSSTDIYTLNNISVLAVGATAVDVQQVVNGNFLDAPATTSAITYKTQGKCQSTSNGGTSQFQPASTTSIITLLEIGV